MKTKSSTPTLLSILILSVGAHNAKSAEMTIAGIPPATGTVGETYRFLPVVENADFSQLQFNYINKPDWSKTYRGSGLLLGVPAETGVYSNIQIGAWDGTHYAVLPPFSITISAPATEPPGDGIAHLTWTPPTLGSDGSPLTDLTGYVIRYGTGLTPSKELAIHSSSVREADIENLTSGHWFFKIASVTGSDDQGQFSSFVETVMP